MLVISKKITYIMTLSLALIVLVGVLVALWVNDGQSKLQSETTVVIDEQTSRELAVSLEGMTPGMSTQYDVTLRANEGDEYKVSLGFVPTGDITLAKFLNVSAYLDGEQVLSASLYDCMNADLSSFAVPFGEDGEATLKIIYDMPLEIGDEAQNTQADFNLILTAAR